MGAPTRLTSGLSTEPLGKPLGSYPLPDPFHTSGNALLGTVTYANDFHTLPGTDFALTTVGVTPTLAIGTGIGGVAVLTTTAGAADSIIATKTGNAFGFVAGQKAWFLARYQLSDSLTCLSQVGLQTGAVPTDGLYFTKASGSTTISLVRMTASVATTLVANVATAVNATYLDLAWYYDGTDLSVFVNDATVARVIGVVLPTAVLTPTITLTNGSAVIRTKQVDYIFAANELAR